MHKAMDYSGCVYTDTRCSCERNKNVNKVLKPCITAHCTWEECTRVKKQFKAACEELLADS
ncbi:Extracellular membrane protein, CFEM domain protein [Metarhizium album ARSEF 1941]|uniref:Extracellular membrane protein, CFEM domain protein n=1 Tax=Metarhizium album (strain ARSEF 1941) TaxID=1081103 RepID=A0A0B2WRI8_METAS|nr:Extracellular membrane protein, CFEM domain protein [Metarhizium album ARSEF 1941]KHN96112.1 Extracellular membrane protein, CFEM domain protein [Metarhizium album ARSEF 1941]